MRHGDGDAEGVEKALHFVVNSGVALVQDAGDSGSRRSAGCEGRGEEWADHLVAEQEQRGDRA